MGTRWLLTVWRWICWKIISAMTTTKVDKKIPEFLYNTLLAHQENLLIQIKLNHSEAQTPMASMQADIGEKMKIINNNMSRIIIQPGRQSTLTQIQHIMEMQQLQVATDVRRDLVAGGVLSNLPKNLFDLWEEYQMGLGGNKAAKEFTQEERGTCWFTYCRRKVFWDIISKHVNAGFTSAIAIDKVYQSYSRSLSVTDIINIIIKDKKNNGHPSVIVC
jgi:hypothetical protein